MLLKVLVILLIYSVDGLFALDAKVSVSLRNSGFHRELKYVVAFPDQRLTFDFYLEQRLPASVYVSVDELSDLKRFNKINYHIDGNVDIENPTEKSSDFLIHLYGRGASLSHITLPIHFRYHAPGNKSFVKVDIEYPQLFVDANVMRNEKSTLRKFKCSKHDGKCNWAEISYDNYSSKPISAYIPIGNTNIKDIVTFSTIALSWVAFVYIGRALWLKCNALEKKLQ